jgi:hypothetical protein
MLEQPQQALPIAATFQPGSQVNLLNTKPRGFFSETVEMMSVDDLVPRNAPKKGPIKTNRLILSISVENLHSQW